MLELGVLGSIHLTDADGEDVTPILSQPKDRLWTPRVAGESLPVFRIDTAGAVALMEAGIVAWDSVPPDRRDHLRAYERYLETPYFGRLEHDPLWLPVVYRELAALLEERGDPEGAAEYHRKLADLWADADPELQPQVRAADGSVARLTDGSVRRAETR